VTRLLVLAGAAVLIAAAATPQGRRVFLRLAWWPLRDAIRADHDRARRETVSPEWLRERGLV
jgi:hypothetical protein